ncbi:hypothetical protein D3C81_1733950 [compost metagenome]
MHVERAVRRDGQHLGRNHRPVVEREDDIGPGGAHGLGQGRVGRVFAMQEGDAQFHGGIGHAAEPDVLVGPVTMGDHQRHVYAPRVQHAQAAVADVVVRKDYRAHDSSTALWSSGVLSGSRSSTAWMR